MEIFNWYLEPHRKVLADLARIGKSEAEAVPNSVRVGAVVLVEYCVQS